MVTIHGNESYRKQALSFFNISQADILSEDPITIVISDGTVELGEIKAKAKGRVLVYYYHKFKMFEDQQNIQLYIDMDGVVSNFEGYFSEKGIDTKDANKLWGAIGGMIKRGEKPFEEFEPMVYARDLYEALATHNPIFLSSTGYSNYEKIKEQKINWLNKHFTIQGEAPRHIIVNSSKKKALFASRNSILIDDRPHSIIPFTEANGNGIIFNSHNISEAMFRLYLRVQRISNNLSYDTNNCRHWSSCN